MMQGPTEHPRIEDTILAYPHRYQYETTTPYDIPPIPPPPPKPRHNWLKGIVIIGVVLLVVVSTGIFGLITYYVGRASIAVTPIPRLSPLATSQGSSSTVIVETPISALPTGYTVADIINDFTSNGLPVSQVSYSISLNKFLDGWAGDDAHNHSESMVTTQPQSSVFFRD